MDRFKNILNCVVIEEYDDQIIRHIKEGGYNVIEHNCKLWIPNISPSVMDKEGKHENTTCFCSKDVLPENAPLNSLKAIDEKISENMNELSEDQRRALLYFLINGVGYTAHYNRHRYKVPEDIYL